MQIDSWILLALNGLTGHSESFDIAIIFFSSYAQYLVVLILLALIANAAWTRSEKIRVVGAAACSVLIARLGIVELIRLFYERPRPFLTQPVHELFSVNEWSFPSGHAAFFFALAASIYGYNKRWGMWLFIAATLISLSRVIAGVHYPSDIIGGAIIGYGIGRLLWYRTRHEIRTI